MTYKLIQSKQFKNKDNKIYCPLAEHFNWPPKFQFLASKLEYIVHRGTKQESLFVHGVMCFSTFKNFRSDFRLNFDGPSVDVISSEPMPYKLHYYHYYPGLVKT